jgi:hypothetical protein
MKSLFAVLLLVSVPAWANTNFLSQLDDATKTYEQGVNGTDTVDHPQIEAIFGELKKMAESLDREFAVGAPSDPLTFMQREDEILLWQTKAEKMAQLTPNATGGAKLVVDLKKIEDGIQTALFSGTPDFKGVHKLLIERYRKANPKLHSSTDQKGIDDALAHLAKPFKEIATSKKKGKLQKQFKQLDTAMDSLDSAVTQAFHADMQKVNEAVKMRDVFTVRKAGVQHQADTSMLGGIKLLVEGLKSKYL